MGFDPAIKLLQLALEMQAARHGITLEQIAERFGVSGRHAIRMKDAILRCFPQAEELPTGEKTKRWRIPPGKLNDLVAFNAEELAALETAVRLMKQGSMDAEAAEIAAVLTKLRALIQVAARVETDLDALLEAEGIAMRPGPKLKVSGKVVTELREAIKACRQIRIYYRKGGVVQPRVVHPYGFLHGHRNYLVAFYSKVGKAVPFSLPSIEQVEVLGEVFVRHEGFDLQRYAAEAFGLYHEESPHDVVWRFSPEAADTAEEFQFHPEQIAERQLDGSLIVRFRASGLLEMAWHLYTWGDQVEVLEPKRLADMVHSQRVRWPGRP